MPPLSSACQISQEAIATCRNTTLSDFLHNFRYSPGLAMHQIEMGSSGRAKRPHRGGVLRIYRQCDPHPTVMIKTIANTYFLANIAPHPHNMEFRCAACDPLITIVPNCSSALLS